MAAHVERNNFTERSIKNQIFTNAFFEYIPAKAVEYFNAMRVENFSRTRLRAKKRREESLLGKIELDTGSSSEVAHVPERNLFRLIRSPKYIPDLSFKGISPSMSFSSVLQLFLQSYYEEILFIL